VNINTWNAAAMVPDTFTPYRPTDPVRGRGCWTFDGFQGPFYAGHLLYQRDGRCRVVGVPAMGCAFWSACRAQITNDPQIA